MRVRDMVRTGASRSAPVQDLLVVVVGSRVIPTLSSPTAWRGSVGEVRV